MEDGRVPESIPEQTGPSSAEPKNNTLATASLTLSIIGLVTCVGAIILAPIALVLGIIAKGQISREPQRFKGASLATSGIVISAVSLVIIPIIAIMAAIVFPAFAKARESARLTSCLSNVKQISLALMMYTEDYDQNFPPVETWQDALQPYMPSKSILVCPSDKSGGPSYGLNAGLKDVLRSNMPDRESVVIVFESKPGKNRFGGRELLPYPLRHQRGSNFGFGDGHVKWMIESTLNTLNWNPLKPGPKSDTQF
ncbi:MAG TPA: DUF4190 domain-containing protein [Armatimonadota bacterium]|jgi:prepilin-type processing-associated H-X9-DG protein